MFMQSPAEGALKWPIGIRRARPASGRDRPSLECQHTIDIIITILITATACCCNDSDFTPPLPLQFLLAILLLEANISSNIGSSSSSSSRRIGGEGSRRISGPSRYCGIAVFVVVITVCAAYAGRSLVAGQTTALCPSLRRTLAVLLAALPLLVLLATLTIAARCYASTASQPSPHRPYRNNHQHHNNHHQNHRNTHPAPFATITNATATATSATTTTTTASTNVLLRAIVQFSPQKLNIYPNNINNHNNNNNRINANNNINNNNNLNSRNSPIIANKYSNSQLHTSKILVLNRNDFPSPTRHARSGDTSGRSNSVIEAETKNRRVEGPRATAKAANTTRGRRKRRDFRSQFYNYNSLDTNDTTLQHKYTVNFSSTSSSSSSSTTTLSSNAISTTTTTSPTSSSFDSVARSGARNNHNRGNSSKSNSNNRNTSSISGSVSSTFLVERKNDFNHLSSEAEEEQKEILRPMPPSHDHDNDTSFGDRLSNRFVFILLLVILLSILLGLATYYFSLRGNRAAIPQDDHLPSTTPMLSVVSAGATAGVGGMDRLRGGGRSTPSKHMHPMEIRRNLPHSISLPDGENHPFNGRLQIRDAEQQSEILQKCIRPPPNRTVLESESPPSYRSGSGGSCNEWSLLSGTRSNSTSSSASSSKRPDNIIGASTSSSCSISPSDGCAAGGSSSGSGGGQKTDFIQKTVKIFTGKKSQQQQQPSPAPAPTLLPQVLVPTARSRRPIPNEPHHQQQHHHNNQQQQQQNNGNAPRPHKPNV